MNSVSLFYLFCALLATSATYSTASYADLLITGALDYRDGGIEVDPPMAAQDAKKWLRYRYQGSQSGTSIESAPPWPPLAVRESDPGRHEYQIRFSEEEEEVTVQLEFSSINFAGKATDTFARVGVPVLHLRVDRNATFNGALEKADFVIENADDPDEILEAFNVLSIELESEPKYKYRGMRVVDELIDHYAISTPGANLPTAFSLYLDSLSDVAPIDSFSVDRKFRLYKEFGSTLSDHFDVLQPIGGGRAVHDLASKLFREALVASVNDDDGAISRSLVANTVLRKVQLECRDVILPDRCMDTVDWYFSNYQTFDPIDVHSFLAILGTSLEIESGIPNSMDANEAGKISRLQNDTYLQGLWGRYFCVAGQVIEVLRQSGLTEKKKSYVIGLYEDAEKIAREGHCDANID